MSQSSQPFHFAARHPVPLSARLLTGVRAIYEVLYKDNPLLWSWRHGAWNPQADLEGPFYLIGAPDRTLVGEGDGKRQEGRGVLASEKTLKECTPFLFAGKVLGQDGTPISGASITFWQADTEGVYDFSTYHLRGTLCTAEDGSFQVLTVKPGQYGPKGKERAGHFHMVITPPPSRTSSSGKRYQELTTQCYVCRGNDPSGMKFDFLNMFRAPRPSLMLHAYQIPSSSSPHDKDSTPPDDILSLPVFAPSSDAALAQAIEEWDNRLKGVAGSTRIRVSAAANVEVRLSEW